MRWPLLLLVLSAPAAAQVPVCNTLREGMAACFEGRLCRCRFEPGGQLTGRPDGHRWDCGALRPDCRPSEPQTTPSTPWPNIVPQIYLDGTRPRPTTGGGADPRGTR